STKSLKTYNRPSFRKPYPSAEMDEITNKGDAFLISKKASLFTLLAKTRIVTRKNCLWTRVEFQQLVLQAFGFRSKQLCQPIPQQSHTRFLLVSGQQRVHFLLQPHRHLSHPHMRISAKITRLNRSPHAQRQFFPQP